MLVVLHVFRVLTVMYVGCRNMAGESPCKVRSSVAADRVRTNLCIRSTGSSDNAYVACVLRPLTCISWYCDSDVTLGYTGWIVRAFFSVARSKAVVWNAMATSRPERGGVQRDVSTIHRCYPLVFPECTSRWTGVLARAWFVLYACNLESDRVLEATTE